MKSNQIVLVAVSVLGVVWPLPTLGQQAFDRPRDALAVARDYFEVKSYDEAEGYVLNALRNQELSDSVRAEAHDLLRQILRRQTEAATSPGSEEFARGRERLDRAKRLLAAGQLRKASATADSAAAVIAKGTETASELAELRRRIAERTYERSLRRVFDKVRTLGVDSLAVVVLTVLAVFIAYVIRKIRSWWHRSSWFIRGVEDDTGHGIGDQLVAALQRWGKEGSPFSVGLLRIDDFGRPEEIRLEVPPPTVDLPVESVAALRGPELNVVASLFKALPDWFNATRPWIKGTVQKTDEFVRIAVTCRSYEGRLTTVTDECSAGADASEILDMVERTSFQAYHIVANGSTLAEAERVEKLRQGVDLLEKYNAGRGTEDLLTEATEIFDSVRRERPDILLAYLYKGIALDLAEKHDEAIQVFQAIQKDGRAGQKLRRSATYNEAIARFRKYEPEEFQEAERILKELEREDKDWASVSMAARANVVAHKPIFWDMLSDPSKEAAKDTVSEWLDEVDTLTEDLSEETAGLGTKWATANAKGNVRLNCAINFLQGPEVLENEKEVREQYLGEALEYFKQCERIAPAQLETLANLGTALIHLGRFEEGREYCEEALSINSDYEYAAYRRCESFKLEGRSRKLKECLLGWDGTWDIPSFRKLYEECIGEEPEEGRRDEAF